MTTESLKHLYGKKKKPEKLKCKWKTGKTQITRQRITALTYKELSQNQKRKMHISVKKWAKDINKAINTL